jgi:hypothetical protein
MHGPGVSAAYAQPTGNTRVTGRTAHTAAGCPASGGATAHLALLLEVYGRVEIIGSQHAALAAGVGRVELLVSLLEPLVEGRWVGRYRRVHGVERHPDDVHVAGHVAEKSRVISATDNGVSTRIENDAI